MFLVFEGIDGAGKSTQIERLAAYLRSEAPRPSRDIVVLEEPGGTPLGRSIRSLLLRPRSVDLSAATEVFLFMAARSHLVASRIRPALERGAIVLCDRFLWSSVVYQGIVGGVGADEVLRLGRLATRGLRPTRTIVLDLPAALAARRRRRRAAGGDGGGDRIEQRGLAFQESVRRGFLELARRFPRQAVIIDARGTADRTHEQVLRSLPAAARSPRRAGDP